MRFSHIERVSDDACLAMDLFGGKSAITPLLRAGVKLEAKYRRALANAGISRVLIEDAESEGIVVRNPLPVGARLEAAQRLVRVNEITSVALQRREGIPYAAVTIATEISGMIGSEVLDSPDVPVMLSDGGSAEGHRIQHAIDVTVLGLLIGRKLFPERGRIIGGGGRSKQGIDDALRRMSLGLLLHDIADEKGADAYVLEDGELLLPENDEARPHSRDGYKALPHAIVSAHAAAIVRHHHERWNGTGPEALITDKIPQFARVAAVADVFDALTSDRLGIEAVAPHHAVAAIAKRSGILFDPEVVDIFRRVVAPYPVGTEVTLTDGHVGVVSDVPNESPHRPYIRLLRDPRGGRLRDQEIALHRETSLAIAAAA